MLTVDHIGYAVCNMEKARERFELLGYQFGSVINDEDRRVSLSFGEKDGCRIEIVAPNGDHAPVDTYLKKVGPIPYHICYCCENLEEGMEYLKKRGFSIMVPPASAVAFEEKRVVFMYDTSIGLIELVEK